MWTHFWDMNSGGGRKIRTFIGEWWGGLWVPKYSFGEMVIQFAAALIVIRIITMVVG